MQGYNKIIAKFSKLAIKKQKGSGFLAAVIYWEEKNCQRMRLTMMRDSTLQQTENAKRVSV